MIPALIAACVSLSLSPQAIDLLISILFSIIALLNKADFGFLQSQSTLYFDILGSIFWRQ